MKKYVSKDDSNIRINYKLRKVNKEIADILKKLNRLNDELQEKTKLKQSYESQKWFLK